MEFNETAVEIGKKLNILPEDYNTPLAFYKKLADLMMGNTYYVHEMTFVVGLIQGEINRIII